MKSQEIIKLIKGLPDTPGVYFFRAKNGDILYIGKATSLRDRVRSYFSSDIATTRGPLIVKLLEEFETIDFQKTDSVLEALILEAHLIKQYQPYYNTKEKSDKSFNFVVITKEDFPRVLLVRGRELEVSRTVLDMPIAYSFGPFPNGSVIREALVLVRKIFPFRDKCVPCPVILAKAGIQNLDTLDSRLHGNDGKEDKKLCKPCFNRQISLCPGVCTGEVTKEEYKATIANIVRFFSGEKKLIIKDLEKRMKVFAKAREFEKASELKRQIFALNHIHDISLIKSDPVVDFGIAGNTQRSGYDAKKHYRIEAYDVAHFAGRDVVGVMTVVEDGQVNKSQYRKFKINPDSRAKLAAGQGGNNDVASLKQMLRRRLGHDEWQLPNLIVVDGAVAQKNVAESVLAEFGYQIPVVAVTKNEYHKPKNILGEKIYLHHESEILLANSEAHRYAIGFHKKLREKLN